MAHHPGYSRRNILKTSLFTGAGLSLTGCQKLMPSTPQKIDKIGVQLYTVRDVFESDPIGTLTEVARIGYDFVEFGGGGYDQMDHGELRRTLDDLGLYTAACHVGKEAYEADSVATTKMLQTLGAEYMVVPWTIEEHRTADGWQALGKTFTGIGETLRQDGIRFAYHNHWFEFDTMQNGKTGYDIMTAAADPAYVELELDIYWAAKAKQDVAALFNQHAGRIRLVHVKDMDAEGEMVDVGDGEIDFAALAALGPKAGIDHYIIEHDNPTIPSLESIARSYAYLQKMEF